MSARPPRSQMPSITRRESGSEICRFAWISFSSRKEPRMAKTSLRQRKTTGRVMHEYAHGELKSGRGGEGGKVKNRKQAIAIALNESGSSKYKSKRQNRKTETKTGRKEAHGRTAQQE